MNIARIVENHHFTITLTVIDSGRGGIAKNGWYHKKKTRNTAFSTSDRSLKSAAKWP